MPVTAAETSHSLEAAACQTSWRPWASIAIESDIAALEAQWRAFEASALATPYQAYGWIRPFVETVGATEKMAFRYALLRDSKGMLCALLPLVITRRSGVRFAELIGGKHANYHMGLYAPAFAACFDAALAQEMLRDIGAAIGGLDAIIFVNQPTSWQGVGNPPALLATGSSPSRAYKLALATDGEATLKRSMSSHARKKLRNKLSRFKEFGPSALTRARSPAEIERVLTAFLAQKTERFRDMGVADPFAEPAIRDFLQQAAVGGGDNGRPVIELYSLDLAGESVATYVGAAQGERFSGMATSFDMGSPTLRTSPGELLLAELIKLKCSEGFTSFDLGVGEARYKTTFCDDHDDLVDSFLPLTAKGRVFVAAAQAKRALKRRIKASPTALRIAQRASGWLHRRRREDD